MTNCSHRKYLGRADNWDLMPLASVLACLFTCPCRGGGGEGLTLTHIQAPLILGHTAEKSQRHRCKALTSVAEAKEEPEYEARVLKTTACHGHFLELLSSQLWLTLPVGPMSSEKKSLFLS